MVAVRKADIMRHTRSFETNGRADPWSNPPPRRFRAMRPTYGLQPMSEDRSGKWCKWLCLVLAGYFAIQLIGGLL